MSLYTLSLAGAAAYLALQKHAAPTTDARLDNAKGEYYSTAPPAQVVSADKRAQMPASSQIREVQATVQRATTYQDINTKLPVGSASSDTEITHSQRSLLERERQARAEVDAFETKLPEIQGVHFVLQKGL